MIDGHIYLITNKVNGKKYVGQTICSPDRRWYLHIYAALRDCVEKQGDTALCRAIRKYGCEGFTAEVIHTCSQSKLDAAEKRFIKLHNCMTPIGYNLTSGGTSGHIVSTSTRAKQSAALRGRVFSAETRAKLSAAQRIRFAEKPIVWTSEARQKLSRTNKGKRPSPQCLEAARLAHLGRPLSDLQKQRIALSNKGKPKSAEHREKIGAAHRGIPKNTLAAQKGWETRRRNQILQGAAK